MYYVQPARKLTRVLKNQSKVISDHYAEAVTEAHAAGVSEVRMDFPVQTLSRDKRQKSGSNPHYKLFVDLTEAEIVWRSQSIFVS